MKTTAARPRRLAWALFIICSLAMCLPGSSWAKPEYRAVTILYTNDTHDHLIPFSYPDPPTAKSPYASLPALKNIGGIARRATLARRIKAEMGWNALLVDAGDVMEGTPFGLEYDGGENYDAMSAAGYDIAVPGNHDFRCTLQVFRGHMRGASFPTVCANLIDRKTGKLELPAYKIYDFHGARIAVFGITVMSPELQAAQEGMDFLNPFDAARTLVPELRKQADIVIALSHLGESEDVRLAKEVPGIDLIVGGHSHTLLAKPVFVRHADQHDPFGINGTLIVQDFEHGAELGRLDLRLRKDTGSFVIMGYDGSLIPVTADIPEDPKTAQVVARYYKPLEKSYGRVIGEATATFYLEQGTVLNLICDSMREASGADLAMYGIGGVRGDIVKGTIKAWDVATVIPYSHKIVVMNLTGEQVKHILIRFPYKPGVSGMTYQMKGNDILKAEIAGKPMDDKAVYKVATIDWLVGLYFQGMPSGTTMKVTARDSVVKYILARKTVSPVSDGRRVVE